MSATADCVGIDGCTGGWVAARRFGAHVAWTFAPLGEVESLISGVTAIDMPIGLLDSGWRPSDLAAKRAMGASRSRVFLTPPREVLELASAPNEVAQECSRRLTGQGVSRQALALAPRILELDAYVAAHPHAPIHECFPEFAFMAMSGSPEPLAAKKSAAGVGQRLAALLTWRADVADVLAQAPAGIATDDCLDALACLWAAEHIAAGMSPAVVWPVDADREQTQLQ